MQVPADLYVSSLLFHKTRRLWQALAGVETALLREELEGIEITAPVYLAGVARSGTTILLEMLSRHPELACHRYSDFPNIYTPAWNDWLNRHRPGKKQQYRERAHADRIRITENSPEAMEEVLWMAFFPELHAADASQVLDVQTVNPAFEAFYPDHIRKLLWARRRGRYITKGNYNLTRLAYVQRLFPDARFIIPVRHPRDHIASLLKQDRLFQAGLAGNQRARRYLAWVGHFEFGPDKRPIHAGDDGLMREIEACRSSGEEVRAWALQWNALYAFVLNQLQALPALREACLLLRYEDLCDDSAATIERILAHCRLPMAGFEEARDYYRGHLSRPDYYRPEFSAADEAVIAAVCGDTAQRFGYALADSGRLAPMHGEP